MKVETIANADPAELAKQVYTRVFDALREHFRYQMETPAVMLLPGGRSIISFLQAFRGGLKDWTAEWLHKLHFSMLDERCVPKEHADANYSVLRKNLFVSALAGGYIDAAQIHPFEYDAAADDFGAERYTEEICQGLNGSYFVVAGVGEDGHIASLFPRHPALSVEGQRFVQVMNSPKPPANRISASRGIIASAQLCVLLVIGEDKRRALEMLQDSLVTVEDCPAKIGFEARQCIIATTLV